MPLDFFLHITDTHLHIRHLMVMAIIIYLQIIICHRMVLDRPVWGAEVEDRTVATVVLVEVVIHDIIIHLNGNVNIHLIPIDVGEEEESRRLLVGPQMHLRLIEGRLRHLKHNTYYQNHS